MKKKNTSSLFRLLSMTKPFIPKLLFCALMIILINLAELAKPYLLGTVIDDFLRAGKPEKGIYSVVGIGIAYFVIVACSSLLNVYQVVLLNKIGQNLIRSMRSRVFQHIQKMPLKALDHFSSGRLVTRGTNDVESVSEFFTDVLMGLVKDFFLVVGIIVTMLYMNWKLALVSFTIIPLIVVIIYTMRRLLRPVHKKTKVLTGRINGFFAENMSGMALVQVFDKAKETMRLFRNLNMDYYRVYLTRVLLNSVNRPIIDLINTLAVCIILWYAMPGIYGGVLEIGMVYAFTTYIKQFFEPIMDFAEKYDTIQSAETSAERIYELLDQDTDLENIDAGEPLTEVKGDIEFKNVWFAYEGENWVLRDISFKVRAGEHIALVGQTGSGKTTIISLLTRLYENQKGQILLDGRDIREFRLRDLRRHIATVLQDPFLFSGTVRENIDMTGMAPDEEILKNAEKAGIQEFIQSLKDGLDEQVAERGATFSAGQRQLISFARALSDDPAVLVLDEATAHIDTSTELMLQHSLSTASAGRTLVVVAHRLSTIQNSDQILVLSHGRIIEKGTHESLLALQGTYYALHHASIHLDDSNEDDIIS